MWILFRYEMKKIFFQKSYIIALIIMSLIIVANEFTPVFLGNYGSKRALEQSLEGVVINEEFIAEISNAEDYKQYGPLESFVKASTGKTDFTGLTAEGLYKNRLEINERLMRDAKLSDSNIEYWMEEDSKTLVPYVFHYCEFFSSIFEICGYMNFMVLIACGIGLSGLFADEKNTRMDQMIYSTKYGKTKLYGIKVLVGIILGIVTAIILELVELILCLCLYGVSGAQTRIQLYIPQCMMPLTMGQAIMVMAIMFVLEAVILSVITMAISQFTMNHPATMAIMFVIMFCGMINIPSSLGVLYMIWDALPGAYIGSWMFDNYSVINIFGMRITNIIYAPVCWIIVGIILLFITKRVYEKYEGNARINFLKRR